MKIRLSSGKSVTILFGLVPALTINYFKGSSVVIAL